MIRLRSILAVVGIVLLGYAGLMLVPIAVAAAYGEWPTCGWHGVCMLVSGAIGAGLHRLRTEGEIDDLGRLEGMGVVGLAWLAVALVGAIPYLGAGLGAIDSLFEAMSGFTTTGATVFTDFGRYSASLFFYRGYTQFLGGMGILVLFVAVLPHLAIAGRQLFFAETSSASPEKLTPRISDTARRLWGWYVALTLMQIALLMGFGMPFNDASSNTFATMAAGGFSPHPESIMGYHNPAAEWVIIVFMFLAGANFTLQVKALRGDLRALWTNDELWWYVTIILASTGVLFVLLARGGGAGWSIESLRAALFQNLSILTTTGFATVDFNLWQDSAKAVLVVLMCIGGCSGSAGGGIKVFRLIMLVRYMARSLFQAIHPRAIITIRVGGRVFSKLEVQPILSFIFIYFTFFAVGGVVAAIVENDLIVGFSGAIVTLGNIGPGFGKIGPMGNFGDLHAVTKLLFTFLMWIGRLEVMAVAVFLTSEARQELRW